MKNIIRMLSANRALAKNLSPQQIVAMFASIRDGNVLSLSDGMELIELFNVLCWQLENEAQQEDCFALLHDTLVKLPQDAKKELAVKLVNVSIFYPRLVFLAEELFRSLPPWDCKELTFRPLGWTYRDDFTLISTYEYEWRSKRGLPCNRGKNCPSRPMSMLDLLCFESSLRMISESGSKVYFYTG